MRKSGLLLWTIVLLGPLGCGGQTEGAGGATNDAGLADATSLADTTAGDATNDASDAGTTDAGVPDVASAVSCDPTPDAGASAASDARAPVDHRPAHACCPTERGAGPPTQPYPPSSLTPSAGGCTSDSDCKAGKNGRCFPESLVGPGGCSYDECFTDSTCGPQATCSCRTSDPSDFNANTCSGPGNCVVDSDCGPGGYCSPSGASCSAGFVYRCHTPSDECLDDSDCSVDDAGGGGCPPSAVCAFGAGDGGSSWGCLTLRCCLP